VSSDGINVDLDSTYNGYLCTNAAQDSNSWHLLRKKIIITQFREMLTVVPTNMTALVQVTLACAQYSERADGWSCWGDMKH
jgi:hypothetical protein